ncbi:DUF4157 domain-containing protein [Nitrosomonas sp.]|uniref:eCIS core domain-containing protein n=1 Tax=Nitrosomonas sp. TaxID=42353 RepID=UPI0025E9E847|nr:DUF4157 domain-containing protein [Nitrosomonas sp.]
MKRSLPVESERQQTRNPAAVAAISSVHQAFVDNRESTAAQRQMITTMANSPQAIAQRQMSQQMHSSSRVLAQRKLFSGESVQRVEEDESLQKKSEPIQRVEEEELQKKAATDSPAQLKEQSSVQTNNTANNTGLPDNLKTGIESLSGMSMDSVRVHYNSSQPAQLNALAYAQGTDIHVAPGQEQHLPHEAWHVVQQAQGRVQPTMQMKDGVPVNDDQGLEREADVMGAKAVQMRERQDSKYALGAYSGIGQTVQRIIHIGREPANPNAYRTITTINGSTPFHYGGGPMNIAAGVYNNNRQNAGVPVVPVATVDGKSDHSSNSLLDRTWASNQTPEIDHIVPVLNYGSNSYNNARVLSKTENNNGVAARPGGGAINTIAHHRIQITDAGGYNHTVAQGGALDGNDLARVTTFGGIGAVIGANSGAVSNNVQIDEV